MDSAEWQAVLRITGSHGFAKSTLLANFLRYVCEKKLQGREGEITEQQIGTHAFGRPAAYNPGDDNIVRNYARILRQRLDDFYAEEGREEPLRIVIPRGSYVPHFEPHTQVPHVAFAHLPEIPSPLSVLPSHHSNEQSTAPRSLWSGRGLRITTIAAAIMLLGVVVYAGRREWIASHPDVYTEFWNEVLPPHRPTVVVLADSGIGILQDFTGVRIRLHEYAFGDTSALSKAFAQRFPEASFGIDRFKNLTSTADIHSLLALANLPQFAVANPRVRSAQEVRMDDLSGSNAIIVGGPRANPWVELYEPVSDFRLEIPGEFRGSQLDARVVLNKSPRTGEATRFSNGYHADEGYVNHSILSFLPSLDGHGHVLLFEGGNMGATQATADFATDRLSMDPILKQARKADGTLRPFEVLLETRVVGASSPKAEVLLVHYK
ncbi:MAG TPA: hypothetical protein VIM67_06585 [Terriglobus sp.]